MTKEDAIILSGVHKSFRLPHEKNSSIKSAFIKSFRQKKSYEEQHVLKDISFGVKKGEFFGIVGRNGSGKSTLLKLMAGIYSPDQGHVQVNGRLTPFIELGVGFNPELTGRENVYLNGALLGFSRKEMDAMYAEIVEFAEIEKFMDLKLKNYSSGMQVRLAFSIAIMSKSDILVFDEVLAVGDEAFQKKSLKIFDEYKARKQTIVLVTHDMETVKRFCTKAILVDDGSIIARGDPHQVSNEYSGLNSAIVGKQIETANTKKDNKKGDVHVKILAAKNKNYYEYGEAMTARITWDPKLEVKNVGVAIYKANGEYVFGANTILDNVSVKGNSIVYQVDSLNIGNGVYNLKVGLFGKTDKEVLGYLSKGPDFVVETKSHKWEGVAFLPHKWKAKTE